MKFTEFSLKGKTGDILEGGGKYLSSGARASILIFSTSGVLVLTIFRHDIFIQVLIVIIVSSTSYCFLCASKIFDCSLNSKIFD